MKRLLLPLLAALALPTGAQEFIEIKPEYIYSYDKTSLRRFETSGKRYLSFKGTTLYKPCFLDSLEGGCWKRILETREYKIISPITERPVYEYEIDCADGTFNKSPDSASWKKIFLDPTAQGVAKQFCPLNSWNELPLRDND